jgi:hypothetical protein
VRRARGRQPRVANPREVRAERGQYEAREHFFRLAAIEEHAANPRMRAKERAEIVRVGRGMHDRTIEAPGPLRRGEHVPQRDAVTVEDLHAVLVRRDAIDIEHAPDDSPERVLRMRVVLLHLQGLLTGQRPQDERVRRAPRDRRETVVVC